MEKAKQAVIRIEMIDGMVQSEMCGADSDVIEALATGLKAMIDHAPETRGMLKKAVRFVLRETRSRRAWEWLHSLKVGVFVIPAVYGLMWLIGEIGHALGVC